MNRHLILCLSLPLMMAVGAWGKQPEPAKDQDQAKYSILICEQASNRIMLMDSEADWEFPDAVIWSWSPKLDPKVDDHQRSWFRSLDDAKPVRHGQQVVVTAC